MILPLMRYLLLFLLFHSAFPHSDVNSNGPNNKRSIRMAQHHHNQDESKKISLELSTFNKSSSIRVATLLTEPFCKIKNGPQTGAVKYEGYVVDLIDEISKLINISYQISIIEDGRYGAFNPSSNQWNGMIGEIVQQRSDMAIADLTVTRERGKAVDFSLPFMTSGIGILYSKESIVVESSSFFAFVFLPFSFGVWFWTTISQLISLIAIKFLPRSLARNIFKGFWCLFTILLISVYIANMVAILSTNTSHRHGHRRHHHHHVDNLDDLVHQPNIKVGLVSGGATYYYFKHSESELHKKLFSSIISDPSVLTATYQEGIERVKHGKGSYAYLMETTVIDYATQRDCSLTQIGKQINYKSYAIAFPINSPLRRIVNDALLLLQETGKMEDLKRKWWKGERSQECLDIIKEDGLINQLGMAQLSSVFFLLIIGLILSITIFIGKHFRSKIHQRNKQPLTGCLSSELKSVALDNNLQDKEFN